MPLSFEATKQGSTLIDVLQAPNFREINYADKAFWAAHFGSQIDELKEEIKQGLTPSDVQNRLDEFQGMVGRLTLSPVVYGLGLLDLQKFLRAEINSPEIYLDAIKGIRLEWRQTLRKNPAFALENFATDALMAVRLVAKDEWDVQTAREALAYYYGVIANPCYKETVTLAKNFFNDFFTEKYDENGVRIVNVLTKREYREVLENLHKTFVKAVAQLPREAIAITKVEEIKATNAVKSYFDKAWSTTKTIAQYVIDHPGQVITVGLAAQTAAAAAFNLPRSFNKRSSFANLSLKNQPIRKGGFINSYDTSGITQGVVINGQYAYLADGSGGLLILNVTNPANPTLTGSYDTPDMVYDVAINNNYAYLPDNTLGLKIVNITNPANVTLTGIYDTPSYANGVAVSGNYAYVADDQAGLQIININDPANPTLASTYDTPSYASGVAINGLYAYVADYVSGLLVINVGNPANPTLAGSYNTPGFARNVIVNGQYAYVADDTFGLQIININNPANPTLVSNYDTPGNAYGVAINGIYAYIADYSSGLQILDVSNLTNPILVGSYNTLGNTYGVAVSGNYAYLADGVYGLQILKIAAPTLITNQLTISEGQSLVLTNSNLNALDADDPASSLSYIASNITGGRFEFLANPGIAITSFNQQQINDGMVQFLHNGNEVIPSYRVIVSDGLTSTLPNLASINYTSVNDAPAVLIPMANQTVIIGEPFNFAVPNTTFIDAEQDPLTLEAKLQSGGELPSWITFNNTINHFSGLASSLGIELLSLFAKDSSNATTQTNFAIQVIMATPSSTPSFITTPSVTPSSSGTPSSSRTPSPTRTPTPAVTTGPSVSNTASSSLTPSPTPSSSTHNRNSSDLLVAIIAGSLGGVTLLFATVVGLGLWKHYRGGSRRGKHQVELALFPKQNSASSPSGLEIKPDQSKITSSPLRKSKGFTTIKDRYSLINKIDKAGANRLFEQTGIEVTFKASDKKEKFTLGRGQFGKLRLAYDLQEQRYIGVKKIKPIENSLIDVMACSKNEGKIQQQLVDCPHIIPLIDSVESESSNGKPVLYQFMLLAGWGNGEEFAQCLALTIDSLQKQKCLVHAAKSLLLGLQAMHNKDIYHLDLKPSNVVFDKTGYLYIIDFGCAENLPDGILTTGGTGDGNYFSPERLANIRYNSGFGSAQESQPSIDAAKIDLWAAGLTLLEWVIGQNPFASNEGFSSRIHAWDSKRFKDILLCINELMQPESSSLLAVIKGLLTIDPMQRLTVKQALALPVFQAIDNQFDSQTACQETFQILKLNGQDLKQPEFVHVAKAYDHNYSSNRGYGNANIHSPASVNNIKPNENTILYPHSYSEMNRQIGFFSNSERNANESNNHSSVYSEPRSENPSLSQ